MKILEKFQHFPKIPSSTTLDERTFQWSNQSKTPMVLTGEMATWPAFTKWDLEYFVQHFGDRKISADGIGADGQSEYIFMDIANFIDYSRSTTDPHPYYGQTNLHLSTSLLSECRIPEQFTCWYKTYQTEEQKIDLSCLYIGPPSVRSRLHQDIWGTSFWNALFEGRKLWLFYGEEQHDLLYGGAVDPFYPDFDKYPKFREAQPQVWLQEAGELIFSPGKVWHAVLALAPCLALSENFINETNYRNVLDHFERHNHLRAYNKMARIAAVHQYV